MASLDAGSSLFDTDQSTPLNLVGPGDSIFLQASSSMNLDDFSPVNFPAESDSDTIAMDECSSLDGAWPSRRLRTRGAFCASDEVPPNIKIPSASDWLDGRPTGLVIEDYDVKNREQCKKRPEILCCHTNQFTWPTWICPILRICSVVCICGIANPVSSVLSSLRALLW